MQKRVILGLDISTSCLGTSIVSYDGENIDVTYVHYVKMKQSKKFKGTDALFYKSQQFKENFIDKLIKGEITDIVIEEPLPGSQNVTTVNTLMKFNGMISQSMYEATGIIPKYISSYDARKFAFPDLMAIRKFNKKDEQYPLSHYKKALKESNVVLFGDYPFSCMKKNIIWNRISELYPNIKWRYDDKGELTVENFDASDSLICILGFLNKEKYGDCTPIVEDYKIIDSKREDIDYEINYKLNFCDKIYDKTLILRKF